MSPAASETNRVGLAGDPRKRRFAVMNIEDRQLDEWLRDVDIPADLSQRLLALPNSDVKVERLPRHRLTVAAVIFAVAASIVGVIVVVRWSNSSAEPAVADKSPNDSPNSTELVNTPRSAFVRISPDSLDDIRANIDFIDIMVRERAIRDLSDKLAAMSKSTRPKSLDSNQRAALIVSMSDQSALQLGAARQWVERDMARVIERFPNTSGAKLAEQFIAQENLQ